MSLHLWYLMITRSFWSKILWKYWIQFAELLIWDIFGKKRWKLKSRKKAILETSIVKFFNCLEKRSGKWIHWNKLIDKFYSYQRCSFEGKIDENLFQIENRLATKFSCNTSQKKSKPKSGTFELMQNKGGPKIRVSRSVSSWQKFLAF